MVFTALNLLVLLQDNNLLMLYTDLVHLCGLVVRVPGYRSRCPGFDFLRSSGSGTESTQPHEDNRGAT
jgi:hypothetical protein